MYRSALLVLFGFLMLGLTQCHEDKIIVLDQTFDDNGKLIAEHIQIKGSDTIWWQAYHENGQVQNKYCMRDGKRNGPAWTFLEDGTLLFRENYREGKLHGSFQCFYPDGGVQRIEHYRMDDRIDTATYFHEDQTMSKQVIYRYPCIRSGNECFQTVIVYDHGTKVYAYEINNGWKSEEHEVFDPALYQKLTDSLEAVPQTMKGKKLFRSYCAACHSLTQQLVGPPLECITQKHAEEALYSIVVEGRDGHTSSKLNREEYQTLVMYLKEQCSNQPSGDLDPR